LLAVNELVCTCRFRFTGRYVRAMVRANNRISVGAYPFRKLRTLKSGDITSAVTRTTESVPKLRKRHDGSD